MPFNCWCLTCKNPIGMGVRYNAEKTKVGMYHSTPIYRFSMPCHLCAGRIVMQTDPQNFDYIILEGARRKNQKWDPEENEQLVIPDAAEKKKLALDAMYHLEHDVNDKTKAKDVAPAIQQLELDRKPMHDDFSLNQLARKQFREAKRLALEKAGRDRALMDRLSLFGSDVKLLPENEEDTTTAKLMRLVHTSRDVIADTSKRPRLSVDDQAIFGSSSVVSGKVASVQKKSESSLDLDRSSSSSGSNPAVLGSSSLSPSIVRTELLKQRGQAFALPLTSPTAISKANFNTAKLLSGVRLRSSLSASDSSIAVECVPGSSVTSAVDTTNHNSDLVDYEDTSEEEIPNTSEKSSSHQTASKSPC
ncbi:unnamed protein product [Calicophoron daubneyi]|uniref:Coiled-coil domain-containing protein 130 n=1 Tax=Calicophoron daubneyi TaxID=300641 RepID=A0AAV2TUS8_CALDB